MIIKRKNKLVIISGSTAVGKDSVVRRIRKHKNVDWIVTHTDRPPRNEDGEINGVDYHFVSKNVFDEMLRNNEFAETVTTGNSRKGTSKLELQKALNDKVTLWRTDLSRAAEIDSFLNSTFDKKCSSVLINSTSVIIIKTHKFSTQRRRALSRGLDLEEFETRIHKDDLPILKKYNDKFLAIGKWENSPIKYHVVYNEDPQEEQSVDEAITLCAKTIMQEIGL